MLWKKLIHSYTREAGVRQLERKIGDICRKSAKEILETKKKRINITEKNLSRYLGKEIYTYQMANKEDEVGIVRGLAWTSVGGDTLQIEVKCNAGIRRHHADRTTGRCDEKNLPAPESVISVLSAGSMELQMPFQ